MKTRITSRIALLLSMLMALAWTLTGTAAHAEPATSVGYPSASTATRFNGLAFDTCTAPTAAQLNAWRASPYRAVGVYIGGANRTCAQPQLTPAWVTAVARNGWKIIPVYMGLQAPCTTRPNATKIIPSQAATQGRTEAATAIGKAKALGMLPGSAIYGDMEPYVATDTACRTAVLTFLSAWTKELHRQGYLSGIYANLGSGAPHLSQAYSSTLYARADAVWLARWDLNQSLTGWAGIPNSQWSTGQRAKQYRGDHTETWAGITMNIDSDRFDAPIATVAYPWTVTSTTPLNARNAPLSTAPIVTSLAPRSYAQVICQTTGSKVGTTTVWNRLSNGAYVTDYYISTPSQTTFNPSLPRCSYPYQTTVDGLTRRTGPSASYAAAGTLSIGSLAWVSCQKTGTTVGTTSVWDRLTDGSWVTDYYVANPSNTTFSGPVQRC